MSKFKPFYIWWIFVLLTVTGVFWGGYQGFIEDIWLKDVTFATSAIALIFTYSLTVMGYVSWYISNNQNWSPVRHLMKRVWFLAEIEMGIAIIGTGLGLILLFGVNSTINASDPASLQLLLTHLWSSLGVAFYPNALGMITSILIKLMVYFISEESENKNEFLT
jgi:hypothetical protein